jgi:2,4-dienoyl-CoA reductase-like NADH-dependent reductase (Old Yellow Enzyme family)
LAGLGGLILSTCEETTVSEPSILFTPARLGAVEIPNRVLMPPMTRSRAGRGGVPGPLAPLYYAQRASAGLIVTEATQVTPAARATSRPPVFTTTRRSKRGGG